MPISADFSIDYTYKYIYHSSGTGVYSVSEFYSWLMDVFDESTTIDDTIPMTAQTPTAFTLTNGWYLNYNVYTSHQYLNGGSIKTSGWDGAASADGIRVLTFQSGGYISAITSDIGKVVTDGTDTGRLLDFDNTTRKWWVRQDALDDNFPSGAITITAGTGAGTLASAAVTGENIWSNPFTIGTLQSNTQIYLIQNDTRITPWWSTGHIDIITLVQEASTLIDSGNITFLARQYTKLYDHFVADLSSGSSSPVPLATFADSNNTTGYRQMALTTASATFTAGELIQDDSDSTIQGVVTSSTGTAPNITLQYYLIGNLNDFSAGTGGFTGLSSASTATAVNPTSVGPANLTNPITITFNTYSQDLNNGNGSRPYACTIDVNQNTLEDLYEYLKYVTRYGETTDFNGHDGEQYYAVGDIYLPYSSQSGAFTEGSTVTGSTSGVTGIIVADHENGTSGALVLRDVSGTFVNGEAIDQGGGNTATAGTPEVIDPVKQSPFGTFAGGKFFGARGVWLANVPAADANNYELIDSEGVRQVPPQTIAITINSVQSGDRVSVFKTTGDNEIIDRAQYTSHATNNTLGANTFETQEVIAADTPTAGTLRIVDNSLNRETRYTYTSWSGSTFSGVSPTLTTTYDGTDTAYVPYVDEQATSTTVSQSIVYASDRFVLTVVRVAGVQPFKVKGSITTSGLTVTAVRNPDSIYQ